jgi:hypothetical protein
MTVSAFPLYCARRWIASALGSARNSCTNPKHRNQRLYNWLATNICPRRLLAVPQLKTGEKAVSYFAGQQ